MPSKLCAILNTNASVRVESRDEWSFHQMQLSDGSNDRYAIFFKFFISKDHHVVRLINKSSFIGALESKWIFSSLVVNWWNYTMEFFRAQYPQGNLMFSVKPTANLRVIQTWRVDSTYQKNYTLFKRSSRVIKLLQNPNLEIISKE